MRWFGFPLLSLFTIFGLFVSAEPPKPSETISLWPSGEDGKEPELSETVKPARGGNVRRITDIVNPSISFYPNKLLKAGADCDCFRAELV